MDTFLSIVIVSLWVCVFCYVGWDIHRDYKLRTSRPRGGTNRQNAFTSMNPRTGTEPPIGWADLHTIMADSKSTYGRGPNTLHQGTQVIPLPLQSKNSYWWDSESGRLTDADGAEVNGPSPPGSVA